MTLPASGTITIQQIRNEFYGGGGPTDLASFRNAILGRSSGIVSLSEFYGRSADIAVSFDAFGSFTTQQGALSPPAGWPSAWTNPVGFVGVRPLSGGGSGWPDPGVLVEGVYWDGWWSGLSGGPFFNEGISGVTVLAACTIVLSTSGPNRTAAWRTSPGGVGPGITASQRTNAGGTWRKTG